MLSCRNDRAIIRPMGALPDHTRHLVERLLGGYCRRICPPTFRHQVVLGWRLQDDAATLYELRSICGIDGLRRAIDVAQFRYDARARHWRLYHNTTEPTRWRRYPDHPRDRSLHALLAEVDADPLGLFWGRVNGASLRWCSSRGRCAGCTEQYHAVLHGDRPAAPANVTYLR